tara:strand:- start:125 stop:769 length:645 start_codon:yes stop_codon:yes gene_type:complete
VLTNLGICTRVVFVSNIDTWPFFVNMPIMSDSKIEILEAAMRVFTRFGLKKTTMKDIAEEAGVARQTVYNAFSSKDVLLCDLIRHAGVQIEEQTRAQWADTPALADKLDIFFEIALVQPFRIMTASPEVETLEESLSAAGHRAMSEVDAIKEALLLDLFADQSAALAQHDLTVEQMAEWVRVTCVGYKSQAKSEVQLRQLLSVVRHMVGLVCAP